MYASSEEMMTAPAVLALPAGYGYEYRSVKTDRRAAGRHRDVAAGFGWIPDGSPVTVGRRTVEFGLKRPQALSNRAALERLERDGEAALAAIRSLDRSRRRMPTVLAYVLGLIGVAAMTVSIFAYLADDIVSTVVGGVLGFVLWMATPAAYRFALVIQATHVAGQVRHQEDILVSISRQAVALLG